MFSLPLDFPSDDWEDWDGPLTHETNVIIKNFITTLLNQSSIPNHALDIAQICVKDGGLGILNPSARAIPDFVLTTAKCIRFATHSLQLNKELQTIPMPPTLAQLFDSTANTSSTYLQHFHHLLPTIVSYATPKTSQNPTNDIIFHSSLLCA